MRVPRFAPESVQSSSPFDKLRAESLSSGFSLLPRRIQPHAEACTLNAFAVLLLIVCPLSVSGQLEWVANETPQAVFAGRAQKIKTVSRNSSDKAVDLQVRMRLFQLSSATSMPVGDAQPWKALKLLANQTVQETAIVTFPSVKARTMFEIQWLDAKDKTLGRTEVAVYPDDLLKQLATLAKDKPIGVLDSDDLLKPSLQRTEVEFEDLESGTALDKYDGPLLIVFSADLKAAQLRHLSERIAVRAKEGVAVVWIQPASERPSELTSLFYPLRMGKGTVVVAPASAVSDLSNSPFSQLNLIRFAEVALRPDSLQLPETP